MTRPIRTFLGAAAAAALLAGCTQDPFERPGTLAPRGFNDANLRAMVVEPSHLRRGVGTSTDRSDAAAKPVDLLRSGKRQPLPSANTTLTLGGGNGGR
jgi:type IV pilus biogenesis protein CpaD/CtpE